MKRKFTLLLIIAVLILTGCSKNEFEGKEDSETASIVLLEENVLTAATVNEGTEETQSDNIRGNEIEQQTDIIDIDNYNISDANLKKSIQECVELIEKYSDFSAKEKAKRMALIYFDEDSMPELLLLKDGEYRLYSYDGSEVKQIVFEDETITANAYGSRHDFEYPGLTFYWFEYVPYRGLLRVHGSNEEERYDHYLKYADGTLLKELTAKSKDYNWYTYDKEKEISNEEFTSQLSNLGYNKLIPCAYFYEDVTTAYKNIERVSDTQKVLEDFVSGKREALCYVEKIGDIPEEGFVTRSFQELYEEMIAGDELWGELEYTDYDNDGEDELIIHGYVGSRMFFDVIGDTVYVLLDTYSTTDNASIAEINNRRVIERTDLLHAGRKYYQIMEYDSCGCLIDWFCLYVEYEGDGYSPEDVFLYRNKEISMEKFEAIVDSIQRIEGNIKTTD